ncbi:GNAT family N-acetyltransferase [Halobacillus sp. BBL2006]|uniref:GNAT family N-acetyltransferase n=1 Tax=Halobacillus sp. BBL2006 TaxID=1543706 RepID=UPI0005430A39|nr:GNAT family N-acetyltransferase [Halobacillus sp. BBL2006]KHE73230.1 GNAT family acetyltransferase [Halobacillus sp. BBL2006]
MKWMQKTYDELTKKELYTILQVRVSIFVVEQECPYPEIDGRDEECLHIWIEENEEIMAYCRIVPPERAEDHHAIGRVLVVKEKRGRGYAKQIMDRAIHVLKHELKVDHIWLHGQEHLRHFYGSFGFEEVSEVYLEDGIPHVDMLMKV